MMETTETTRPSHPAQGDVEFIKRAIADSYDHARMAQSGLGNALRLPVSERRAVRHPDPHVHGSADYRGRVGFWTYLARDLSDDPIRQALDHADQVIEAYYEAQDAAEPFQIVVVWQNGEKDTYSRATRAEAQAEWERLKTEQPGLYGRFYGPGADARVEIDRYSREDEDGGNLVWVVQLRDHRGLETEGPLGPFRSYGTGSLYEPDGESLKFDPFLPNFTHREDFASEAAARTFIARVRRCETLAEVYADAN